MTITIGYDFEKNQIIKNEPYKMNKDEIDVINAILKKLDLDASDFKIVKPCEDYTTLQYKERDLFRLKYTEKAKWIKILIFPSYKNDYIDNPLFSKQKNKNQVFWQSYIENIFDYNEIILRAVNEIKKA